MKNKKVTIILIGGVALLWGIVIFRMVKVLGPGPDMQGTSINYEMDTTGFGEEIDFKLSLNYPDPFLQRQKTTEIQEDVRPERESVRDRLQNRNERSRRKRTQRVRWPEIQYGGIIREVNDEDKIALVRIGGRDYLMTELDAHDEVKLLQIYKDSVVVEYETEEKTILRNE